jgi:hypothetical protein
LAQGLDDLHDQLRQGGRQRLWDNPEVDTALSLSALNVPPGTPVAEIGDLTFCYFPHVALLRILARVEDAKLFWSLPEEKKQQVYDTLAAAGLREVIAVAPASPDLTPGWIPLGDGHYVLHRLPAATP